MNETKWWMDSMTIRGALLTTLPTLVAILKLFGVEIGEGEVNVIVEGLAGIAGLIGGVMAIVGRFRAKHALTQ